MAYIGLPTFVSGFDHREVERLLNRSRFNSFLTALFSAGVCILCIAAFIFEWWTLTTSVGVDRFYVTGKVGVCDASGNNCVAGTLASVSTSSPTTALAATRVLALAMTVLNLLNGAFAVLFSVGHSSYLSRIVEAVPTLGATALQTPPGMFLERYHTHRRGPASFVTGGIAAALIALAPFGAVVASWINGLGVAVTQDPGFDSRPGSGFFTIIVTIAAWLLVAFNIRRADFHYRYAQNLCAVAGAVPLASAAVIIAPGGGYLPAGADFAPPAPGYAPYAPQPAMGGQGFY